MGWQFEGLPDHEGYPVGFVAKEGTGGLVREIGYPENERRVVLAISAACVCGWRSPRWKPAREDGKPTAYSPCSVSVGAADDERAYRLVAEHFADVRRRKALGRRPHDPIEVEPHWDLAGDLPYRQAHE